MRRNCETDWAQRFPQYAVSEWIGHDITVSAIHYLAVTIELYEKAAGVSGGWPTPDMPKAAEQESGKQQNTTSRAASDLAFFCSSTQTDEGLPQNLPQITKPPDIPNSPHS